MKKYVEILEEIKKARAGITDTAKTEKEATRALFMEAAAGESEEEKAAAREAMEKACARLEKENARNTDIKLKIEILKDNAAQAVFSEIIATICDIWNKYENKPHGEKTAQKIRDELKAATGYRVYIGNRYDDANIKIYFDYGSGAPFHDIEFIPIWNGEKQPALINNKVVKIAAENFRVYCGREYVENVDEHIKAIKEAHAAALEAEKALENAIKIYNDLTRGNIQHASTREGVRKWLI